jgi:hypothetical protein
MTIAESGEDIKRSARNAAKFFVLAKAGRSLLADMERIGERVYSIQPGSILAFRAALDAVGVCAKNENVSRSGRIMKPRMEMRKDDE